MLSATVTILGLRLLQLTTATPVLNLIPGPSKESSPNPIAALYPNSVTGTINGTLAVVPIPFELARSIIPSQYGILKGAYESLLPGFPQDKYPMIVKSIVDHDIRSLGLELVPDFQSIHILFPFTDLLNDGYSSFIYDRYILLTATNLVASAGTLPYGEVPIPAYFDPPNEAYEFAPSPGAAGTILLDAYTVTGILGNLLNPNPVVTTRCIPLPNVGPWPLNFYINITNQPITSNGQTCDQQIHLWNTTLSQGVKAPVGIKGDITIDAPYLPTDSKFNDVYGVKVDIAFIENNLIPCGNLKGYSFM